MQAVSGNAAKAGIKAGDTVIYTSSWFGEELWPADSPNFVNTALARAPSPVYIKYVKGANNDIAVRPRPARIVQSSSGQHTLGALPLPFQRFQGTY